MSPVTVSHVLNPKRRHRFRKETQERVLEAARELGYRPNAAARAMSTGRFGVVALLLSTDQGRSFLPDELLNGIHDAAAEGGFHLNISKLPDAKLTDEGFVPRILREWMVDGLLINYTDRIPGELIRLVRENQIPSVWINSKMEADCVRPDDFDAAREATKRLLELGHRRIAYADLVHGNAELGEAHYSVSDRQAGYEAALAGAEATGRIVRRERHLCAKEKMPVMCELLTGDERPTAILSYGWVEALTALIAAREVGLRVPEDLSIACIATGHIDDFAGIRLSAVRLPEEQVGSRAGEMLIEKIDRPTTPLPPVALPGRWLDGDTAGPAPSE